MTTSLVPVDAPPADVVVPATVLDLLERRYLNALALDQWAMASDATSAVPQLHEVDVLGLPTDPQAMPVALSSVHEPGQALVGVAYHGPDDGGGFRQRRYYGSRRQPGGGSAGEYLEGLRAALCGYHPGLKLADAKPITDHAPLADFLRTAPVAAVVTGIPASKLDRPGGLEVLARSGGAGEYAVVVVADPRPVQEADTALDACRRMQTDISGLMTKAVTRGQSRSEGTPPPAPPPPPPGFEARLPGYIQQTAGFISAACRAPGLGLIGFGAAVLLESLKSPTPIPPPPTPTITTGETESATMTLTDAAATACNDTLARHTARIRAGRGWGWWRVAVYILADTEATLQAVGRAVRTASAGEDFGLDPIRVHPTDAGVLREAVLSGGIYAMRPKGDAPPHPLGPSYDALATCLGSQELAALLAPPRAEVPGLILRDRGEFPVTAVTPTEPSIVLGTQRDAAGTEYAAARLTARHLNEHLLVVGMPGLGKTNTCMNLLIETDKVFHVPFLVIEPAKTEYRRLTKVQGLGDCVRVFTPGSSEGRPLRLNPLSPVPGASLLGHIDALKAVFNASFAMGPGLPQILEDALIGVYEDRGWNLFTGTNPHLGANPTWEQTAALTPCLEDLHDCIDVVVKEKGYGGEIKQNLAAALKSRLKGLTLGAKGMTLNCRASTPTSELFDAPAVLELQHLRDDEEKAFLMALVFTLLGQHCEVRQRHRPAHAREQLMHVTLIEEAHRLLGTPGGTASADSADPKGKAVSMFTDMLAELRALGEGFVIVDQIPTKLAPDTLKNTNTKILHRLTSPTDRQVAGQSVNLTERQSQYLAGLSKGLAVVHGLSVSAADPVAPACLVQMTQVKGVSVSLETADLRPPPDARERQLSRRHGGCRACPSPCDFFPAVDANLRRKAVPKWVATFVDAAVAGDWTAARAAWPGAAGRPTGEAFCETVHHVRDRLMERVAVFGMGEDREPRLRPADRVLAEQLAGLFGEVLLSWLNGADESQAVARQVASLLAAVEPPELAGCAACPARCAMLASVSRGHLPSLGVLLASAAPKGAQDGYGATVTAETRVMRVVPKLQQVEPPPPAGEPNPAKWKRDWRYCLLNLVPLPTDQAEYRDDMLAVLRATPV